MRDKRVPSVVTTDFPHALTAFQNLGQLQVPVTGVFTNCCTNTELDKHNYHNYQHRHPRQLLLAIQ